MDKKKTYLNYFLKIDTKRKLDGLNKNLQQIVKLNFKKKKLAIM